MYDDSPTLPSRFTPISNQSTSHYTVDTHQRHHSYNATTLNDRNHHPSYALQPNNFSATPTTNDTFLQTANQTIASRLVPLDSQTMNNSGSTDSIYFGRNRSMSSPDANNSQHSYHSQPNPHAIYKPPLPPHKRLSTADSPFLLPKNFLPVSDQMNSTATSLRNINNSTPSTRLFLSSPLADPDIRKLSVSEDCLYENVKKSPTQQRCMRMLSASMNLNPDVTTWTIPVSNKSKQRSFASLSEGRSLQESMESLPQSYEDAKIRPTKKKHSGVANIIGGLFGCLAFGQSKSRKRSASYKQKEARSSKIPKTTIQPLRGEHVTRLPMRASDMTSHHASSPLSYSNYPNINNNLHNLNNNNNPNRTNNNNNNNMNNLNNNNNPNLIHDYYFNNLTPKISSSSYQSNSSNCSIFNEHTNNNNIINNNNINNNNNNNNNNSNNNNNNNNLNNININHNNDEHIYANTCLSLPSNYIAPKQRVSPILPTAHSSKNAKQILANQRSNEPIHSTPNYQPGINQSIARNMPYHTPNTNLNSNLALLSPTNSNQTNYPMEQSLPIRFTEYPIYENLPGHSRNLTEPMYTTMTPPARKLSKQPIHATHSSQPQTTRDMFREDNNNNDNNNNNNNNGLDDRRSIKRADKPMRDNRPLVQKNMSNKELNSTTISPIRKNGANGQSMTTPSLSTSSQPSQYISLL